jgi:DNA-directed RNA polymerase specialized sigma subunit
VNNDTTSNRKYETQLAIDYNKGKTNVLPELLTSLSPLIHLHSNKWAGNLPQDVLQGEATNIIVNSLPKFDPKKSSLSTFLNSRLQQLSRFVYSNQNMVRLSEPRNIKVGVFKREQNRLRDELGREPNTIELADALSWNVADVEKMLRSLTSDYVASSSKYEGAYKDDKYSDYIEYFYRGLNPENQVIFAHTMGYAGQPQLSANSISGKLNKSPQYVRDQQSALAQSFRRGLKMGVV